MKERVGSRTSEAKDEERERANEDRERLVKAREAGPEFQSGSFRRRGGETASSSSYVTFFKEQTTNCVLDNDLFSQLGEYEAALDDASAGREWDCLSSWKPENHGALKRFSAFFWFFARQLRS